MRTRYQKPLFQFLRARELAGTAFTLDDLATETGMAAATAHTYFGKMLKERWVFPQEDGKHLRVNGFLGVREHEFHQVMSQKKLGIRDEASLRSSLEGILREARRCGLTADAVAEVGLNVLAICTAV